MDHRVQSQIVNFIWRIADDVLRDIYTRGKYRDVILPFTVLRRLDALLEPTKEKVLEVNQFLIENQIDDKSALKGHSGYKFYNTSKFTFKTLLNDPNHIGSNLENYLDGFSEEVQQIISKFKLKNQLETLEDAGITFALISKFVSRNINLSPKEAVNSRSEILPPLTNLGMGYVFEELIRRFNEENNEEAGEHFTPREIIKLMTHLLFLPVRDKLTEGTTYLIYDPACGSGGMLTEAEQFAKELTHERNEFFLYGQEVNAETYAVCTSDMLIKDKDPDNIAYGSTLSKDSFPHLRFDFMLSNPPYGKNWEGDYDAIVGAKKQIKDDRFRVGVPRISDGQLLFLVNMIAKMKNNTISGSRIAIVHNGSALFAGDAGSGESEIRKQMIERDWLECIIELPQNIFYNTGISTYIWILSNRKQNRREGKIQLIDASQLYQKLNKNLGKKNCELTDEHIDKITQLYLNFEESEISKIFSTKEFGYQKITVERPLRLSSRFTLEGVETLRFANALRAEMEWVYKRFGAAVYEDLAPYKQQIEAYLTHNEIKIRPANKKKLLDPKFWNAHKEIMEVAEKLMVEFGDYESSNFNDFQHAVGDTLQMLGISLSTTEKKRICKAVSWRDENALPIIKKRERDGTLHYEPDPDLRDREKVPLMQEIDDYFQTEVVPYVPDAWIDERKTVKGYEISFSKYFYQYQPLPSLEEIAASVLALTQETEDILQNIIKS